MISIVVYFLQIYIKYYDDPIEKKRLTNSLWLMCLGDIIVQAEPGAPPGHGLDESDPLSR